MKETQKMNVVLTSACDKNCSFCFAKPYVTNPDKELLNFNKFKEIVNQSEAIGEGISLLGGEPTMYPQFIELLDYLLERKLADRLSQPVLLISNLLFKDINIAYKLEEVLRKGLDLNFLLNVAEMSSKQMELFLRNIKAIPSAEVSPGITLSKNIKSSYYIKNLATIIDQCNVTSIRLSIPNPMYGTIVFEDYHNNEMPIYRQQLKDIIDFCLENEIEPSFDCGTTLCLFQAPLDGDKYLKYVHSEESSGYGCNNCALDLKPDGTMISCYPGEFISDNISNHQNELLPLIKSVRAKKQYFETQASAPKMCLDCEHYLKLCHGPCVGFYKGK